MDNLIEGKLSANKFKIAIVVSRWNEFVNRRMLEGAVNVFSSLGGNRKNLVTYKVPGAFEIPVVCSKIASTKKFDGILAIGTVIRGQTSHYEHVAGSAVGGIQQVSLQYEIPVGLSVLTTENIEQAIDRAGAKSGNKGTEGMMSLIETIDLLNTIAAET